MKLFKKYRKFLLFLLLLASIFLVIDKTSSSEFQTRNLGQQRCPKDFNLFDNRFFSICLPSNIEIQSEGVSRTGDKIGIYVNLYESNTKEIIGVGSGKAEVGGYCTSKENAKISGYDATRFIRKEAVIENPLKIDRCLGVIGYTSIIFGPGLGFTLSYDQENALLSRYATIEQSIKLKKNPLEKINYN